MTQVFAAKIPKISADTFERLLKKVSAERREKISKLIPHVKKCQSLFVELLLRSVLVSQFQMTESDIVIEKTPEGKPFLKGDSGLFISLSHCDGLVAVAVSNKAVGVDSERVRSVDTNIAKRFFTELEQEYVFGADDGADERFFEIWTRKEALAKHQGIGLSDDTSVCTVENTDRFQTFAVDGYIVTVCTDKDKTDASFSVANELLNEYIV